MATLTFESMNPFTPATAILSLPGKNPEAGLIAASRELVALDPPGFAFLHCNSTASISATMRVE
jgi:hypothetical protein